MNILPHKSWHVRNKKNIERVRRDEEKAAEEEKEKQRRIALAEQEARTDLLRKKAKNRALPSTSDGPDHLPCEVSTTSQGDDSVAVSSSKDCVIPGLGDSKEHMNFFKEIEDGLVKQGTNKEHEAEKKKEQEELEKRIGLLTYLGQTALDNKESAPWYLDKKLRKKNKSEDDTEAKKEDKELELKRAVQQKRLEEMDPLLQMKQYVEKKKHGKHKKHKHKDKKRSHKDEKERKKIFSSSDASIETPTTKKTIEQLRAERIARERKEKLRTQALLTRTSSTGSGNSSKFGASKTQSHHGNSSSSSEESDREGEEERRRGVKRRYNSQYNPEFVRQPKSKYKPQSNHGSFKS
ncbi:leukocyte receptor cluster member 1 [Elysia marginata]|uniref:Leukocyte receptor cluster member 1 n=1 Tax=Elysia marginata TaxID=1093978 RepID=A0AAV4JLJ9_9GAST|nr:leukocyte receptor cluster member 1 [Elysia marginata]